jgi:signal transduction histidine kinase
LLGWRFGTLVLLSGSYLGLELFKAYSGSHVVITNIDTSAQAVVLYMLFVISAAVVIFLKPRQEDRETAEEKIDHLQYRITDYTNELYKANEIRNEFLRNLQHEARTPITGITSMAQAVDAVYDQLPEERRRQAIKDIASSAERLESFVNNLVDLSHIVTENYSMQTKEVSLSILVQKALDKCRKLYIPAKEEGKREFTLSIEPSITLLCDEYYIRRTIENIIINAIKYCTDGEIKISLAKAHNVIVLKVRDSGIGVPQEYMKDIFGAFTTSAKTRTPAGGRGVGLALAKKVMDKHKGEITVSSDGSSWTEVECRWGDGGGD